MPSSRAMVKGAAILTLAAILSKVMGSIYTVFLQNVIGDSGMGLYQMAYPIYATLLIISTAGFPVAVSKFVSEHAAFGDVESARRVYRVSSVLLGVLGMVTAVGLYLFAAQFARISGDPRSVYAIRAIAPALFIVPMVSSLRGYFQGWQQMKPTAISQLIEQLIRVTTILCGAYIAIRLGMGNSTAAAVAAFGAVTGGLAAWGVLAIYAWRARKRGSLERTHESAGQRGTSERAAQRGHASREGRKSTRSLVWQLIYYAVPVSLGALVIPIISNVDALTVTNLLKHQGFTQEAATRAFGLLSGRAFKLAMLPATLASSVGAALLPSVSEAHTLRNESGTAERVQTGLRMTALFSIPAAVGLTVLARPIDIMLFRNAAGYHSIQILAVATVFSTLQIALAASLQGIGRVFIPFQSLLLGTAVKIGLNLLLVPHYGIDGAAMATAASYGVAALYNLLALRRVISLGSSSRDWLLRPLVASGIMGAFTFAVYRQWERIHVILSTRLDATVVTMLGVGVGIAVYLIALLVSGGLTDRELSAVPKVGRPLVRTFKRIGIL
ncbi:putative polysaccharide biosynthesis protein [Ferroacidibacillus organovorans]|uniref:Uncharacterized protein n=1 Tax=Ferroacidibacillus organovorans TaxID=1765683 RepID=A0A101XRW5_9BACL|nr:polysaccharide biosynthesis protein [Ferroacidibacillus organovorans]KUO96401.1 hypothetical protein ATW55_00710 [Ferroacidibacillus organovorans]